MSIISTRTRRVKTARRTVRPDRPFGSGLTHYVAFAVTAPGFVEPSDEDRTAAALLFADDADWDARLAAGESDADLEMRAAEAAYYDWCQGW